MFQSMILQPIVENCIKHGFDEIEQEKIWEQSGSFIPVEYKEGENV